MPALSKPPVLTDDSMFSVKSAPIVPTPKFKSSVEAVINYESTGVSSVSLFDYLFISFFPVPVYDGRSETGPAFRFSAADFNAITSWRSYNGNTSDVPEGSVVAVGYTAGWFEGSSSVYVHYLLRYSYWLFIYLFLGSFLLTSSSSWFFTPLILLWLVVQAPGAWHP